jgi:hypothetical protein
MALGNNNYQSGSKKSNFAFQLKVLQALQRILNGLGG